MENFFGKRFNTPISMFRALAVVAWWGLILRIVRPMAPFFVAGTFCQNGLDGMGHRG